MASIQYERRDKKGYWQNELRSLSIEPKRTNELNDAGELSALTDNIKQTYFQDYKTAYDKEQEKSNYEYSSKSFDYIV